MERAQIIIRKRVEGEEFNNGEFAEALTTGIEGIEEGLLLEAIQIHCCDTENTPEQSSAGSVWARG